MPSRLRLTSFLIMGGVLAVAIGLIVYTTLRPLPPSTLTKPLADLLPRQINGWVVKDQPIADTEEMRKAVGEILNYDDAIFRTYTRDNTSIAIYAAYWKPGKMSSRLINAHTPDNCWVNAGWKCTARSFDYKLSSNDHRLRTAQWGIYEIQNIRQEVLFWHLSNQQLVSYETGRYPPWWAPFKDLWEKGLNQRGEQFFIRISSETPVGKFWDTPVISETLRKLGPLALYEPPAKREAQ